MTDPVILAGGGFAIGIWLGIAGMRASYRNGVIDGAQNAWLPHVKRILARARGVKP